MKVEVIGKEMIKPSSPTPDHHRTVQLSFLDHFFPPVYVPAIFFYKAENHHITEQIISLKLKKSLSETLTRFYPLAGRIEGVSINCNDKGALFMEARVDCLLSSFLSNADASSLELLAPSDFISSGDPPATWPLLLAKVSFFRCGGMAISVFISHKICDGASLVTFVRAWTETAKGNADVVKPEFTASTFFPVVDPSFQYPSKSELSKDQPISVLKRFVFHPSKIQALKTVAHSESVPSPTRVEAVTALIWECATRASRSNSATLRQSVMTQAMDLRLRLPSSQMSRDAIGNLMFLLSIKQGPEKEMEIPEIVSKLRITKEETEEMIKENLQGDTNTTTKLGQKMLNAMVKLFSTLTPEMNVYTLTSWCRLPYYEADFGWGSPVWVTPGPNDLNKNTVFVMLMDAKDGEGIEAWANLPEPEMSVFELDQELLAFATPSPI